jgi:2-polyprenyl-6-methoxyphenol hydroxylase-like FAD-dependent oxidoreductase
MNHAATVTTDIVIIGAGFTGAFAAAALADGRRRIVVLDSQPAGRPRFGGELIHAAGVDILGALGLWPLIAGAAGEQIRGFRVSASATDTPVSLPYSGVPAARPGGLAIDHQEMLSRVHAYLRVCPGIDLRNGQRVTDLLHRDGRVAGVRTATGHEIRAGLTLIADGRHSRLRQAVGIRAHQRPLSLSVMVLAENAAVPAPGYAHIYLGAPGPILAYPLRDNRVRFCIDVPMDVAPKREHFPELLRSRYAQALPGPLRSHLLGALDTSRFEIAGNHTVWTDRCTVPGAALLGDAAGCSHPLTASGMTNSLNDIRLLADELRHAPSVDAALAHYAVQRYRFVRIREILADELYDAFRADDTGCPAIRDGIFRYWRTSAHGRVATVALLSGDDARVSTFMAEYVRVIRQSIHAVILGQRDGSFRRRAHSLSGLMKESLDLLNRVGAGVYTGTLR